MNEDLMQPVVVGVDGSASAAAAVDVAAAEAVALGAPLRIVHAYAWPLFYASLVNVPYRPEDWELPPRALDVVRLAARRIGETRAGLPVETAVAPGTGGAVLVDESAHASLVVIGAQGAGGIAGLLSGSVAAHVSVRARCPVIVVRAGQEPVTDGGQVAVGVDGTPSALAALRFARDWATRRRASIVAIHASGYATGHPRPEFSERIPAELHLAGWLADAGVQAEARAVPGDAVDALVDEGRSARLLVVGSGHRGVLASAALGPVGRALIRRAPCPVAIVPEAWDTPRESPTPAVTSAAR